MMIQDYVVNGYYFLISGIIFYSFFYTFSSSYMEDVLIKNAVHVIPQNQLDFYWRPLTIPQVVATPDITRLVAFDVNVITTNVINSNMVNSEFINYRLLTRIINNTAVIIPSEVPPIRTIITNLSN